MDPRHKALQNYFENVEISRDGVPGKIVKINMYPNAKRFFLTVEDLVSLAELNNKYKDYYLDVNSFCKNLCQGKYSMGSGVSQKLKDLHDRVKELEDELNFKLEMEENLIEQDMNTLKEMVLTQVEEYFGDLKTKLKGMFNDNNAELRQSLVEANKILKQELLTVLNEGEFFDLNKFFVQFNEMKDEPEEFELFLREYVNNDQCVEFTKTVATQLERMSPIFNEAFDIDSKMSNYVLNIEKLSHNFIPHEDDMVTVLEGFSKSIVKQIDSTMMKVRHFTSGELIGLDQTKIRSQYATPSRAVKAKSRGSRTGKRSGGGSKKKKPTNEIELIKFKNVEDLQYDYQKFVQSSVGQVVLELHGNNLNQKSCEYMGHFLGSLYKLDHLKLNFSM